jgi:hypothetical protein
VRAVLLDLVTRDLSRSREVNTRISEHKLRSGFSGVNPTLIIS